MIDGEEPYQTLARYRCVNLSFFPLNPKLILLLYMILFRREFLPHELKHAKRGATRSKRPFFGVKLAHVSGTSTIKLGDDVEILQAH